MRGYLGDEMTTPEDLIAVQRVYAECGREAAGAEVRKRWPMVAENAIERTLNKILAAPVEPSVSLCGQGSHNASGAGRPRKWE